MRHRACPASAAIADRHYNRQKVGAPQFVPPGRCLVLLAETPTGRALWVTSWPFAEYVKHRWAGAWVCSLFRNEGAGVASELITDAIAATRFYFGDPPALGMVTFISPDHVKPYRTRGRMRAGFGAAVGDTYRRAGFELVGGTQGGLPAFVIPPGAMPGPAPALGMAMELAL